MLHSHLGGVFAWTPVIEGEDAGEQGLRTQASKEGRCGRSRHEDAHSSEMTDACLGGGVTWTPAIEVRTRAIKT
jgi:hypothetical protein